MARPIVWPQVPAPAEEASAVAPAEQSIVLDVPAIAAALGPELARLMGLRVSARPDETAPLAKTALALGRIRLAGKAPVAMDVACIDDGAAMLMERLFGARGADAASAGAADLLLLPPGSASWSALCRTVLTAVARALASCGLAAGGAPLLPARALRTDPESGLSILLDVDGIVCRLRLTPELPPAPPPPPRAAPDMALWRQQARARAFELELPVSLRIADTRMPVTRVAELVEGDIIPLDRPDKLDVMAAGRRIARLPASSFQFAPETGRTDASGSDEATSDGVSSR